MKLVECVPNFSEGRDKVVIKKITDEIEKVEGVKLLDVDPGEATNRTVVTFIGEPGPVKEAAFRAIKKASEVIDMSKHQGEHARMGATDVCPFVPVSGVTMEDCVRYAHDLGKRVGEELEIPIYFYEHAATCPERQNLADVRAGEYEGLTKKLADPNWKPDCGPAKFNPQIGATAISAREFLIAFNINLNTKNTTSTQIIALTMREKGRVKRGKKGKRELDKDGNKIFEPGLLKATKAVGWYIEEFGFCQISMNLVNYKITPPHIAFDTACELAEKRGLRVIGGELVGLIPKEAMLQAGRHYLQKQKRSPAVSEEELIQAAVLSMGLDHLAPFDPKKKIIEYTFKDDGPLVKMNGREFLNELASESPAPGGGSVAAYAGAMGAGLVSMVGNLTVHKRKFRNLMETLVPISAEAQQIKDELRDAIDADTEAFNDILTAMRLPKSTDEEIKARDKAVEDANKGAADVPFITVKQARRVLDLAKVIIKKGNPNSITDGAVGAAVAYAAVKGAEWNVRINLQSVQDEAYKKRIEEELTRLVAESKKLFDDVVAKMDEVL